MKSNQGFNLQLTNRLIIAHWNKNVGTTSKTAFTVCGTLFPHSKGQQAPGAQILDKPTEYIQYMQRENYTHQQDIDDLKRQNDLLEQQVHALERQDQVSNCGPTTTPQTIASTPAPGAVLFLPLMEAQTAVWSQSLKSPKTVKSPDGG